MIAGVAMRLIDGTIHSLPKPARHADLIRKLVKDRVLTHVGAGIEQGFIDEDGRFYRRAAAKHHVHQCGQEVIRETHPRELFSEDVW